MYSLIPPLPETLQVEVTSACNLRCAMCLVRYRPPVNRLAGAMDFRMFRDLVSDLPDLRQLTLQGLGEPLLSPHLLDMVRLAHEQGTRVGFNSNATLLTQAKSRQFIEAGLDWLHVSLDGADAATFEAIRDGAAFDKVVGNLAGLLAVKQGLGADNPWVRVVFVAMRRNVTQLPRLVELLAEVGVGELRVQNLSHSFDDTDPSGAYAEIRSYAADEALWGAADQALAEESFAAARAAADATGLSLRLPRLHPEATAKAEPGRPGCTWPWDGAYVTSNGVVQPCCMVMGDDRVALGHLAEQRFPEIWAGQAYQEFRRGLRGPHPPTVCQGCSLYTGTF